MKKKSAMKNWSKIEISKIILLWGGGGKEGEGEVAFYFCWGVTVMAQFWRRI